MSYYIRRRTVARDNISATNATGKERTINGNAGTTETVKECVRYATTIATTDIYERIVSASTSFTGTTAHIVERMTTRP